MRQWIRVIALLALGAPGVWADKGHIWPHPVALSEASQKAIILHNRGEEVLILGVELQAQQATDILEFIPFPSEPQVALAKGNPFERAKRLMEEKGLEIESAHPVKGASALGPVEIRFSEKIGMHQVTVIKLNDTKGFAEWVAAFFAEKGIPFKPDLSKVLPVAEDYLHRGFAYFVFDYVPVGPTLRFIEPLTYRFRTKHLYYPLKTSNIVGGQGAVDIIMVLPGSFVFESEPTKEMRFWSGLRDLSTAHANDWRLSSSSKLNLTEAGTLYPEAGKLFAHTKKVYLQALQFRGDYQFSNDLLLDLDSLAPYPSKRSGRPFGPPGFFFEKFTPEEIQDYCEAKPNSPLTRIWLAETQKKPKRK